MKTKINIQLYFVSGISILLTAFLTVLVFYNLFQKQMFEDLNTYAKILSTVDFKQDIMGKPDSAKDLRVTWIGRDGEILFESDAEVHTMDNHRERPEIVDAAENGTGKIVRKSETLGKNTYYFAIRLEDGTVLRVSKEASSITAVFYGSLPVLILCAGGLFLLCFLLSHVMTLRIVRPIETMANNIERIEECTPYDELRPFAKTIAGQHKSIKKQLMELEKGEKIRQEFTANVSHELKTPLTSISGYAELLEQGMARPEDAVRFAGEIKRNSSRLLTLINDILELSKLDEESKELVKQPVDLFTVAEECIQGLLLHAKNSNVTLTLSGIHCTILADKGMMEELIFNLCDNAIRYNKPHGTVKVSVIPISEKGCIAFEKRISTEYKRGKEKHRNCVLLTVEDSGIGIPDEHKSRIFERFYRVDKSRSKATGGTGLGLAIVKHIVAKHHAQIILESKEQVGTKVEVLF